MNNIKNLNVINRIILIKFHLNIKVIHMKYKKYFINCSFVSLLAMCALLFRFLWMSYIMLHITGSAVEWDLNGVI